MKVTIELDCTPIEARFIPAAASASRRASSTSFGSISTENSPPSAIGATAKIASARAAISSGGSSVGKIPFDVDVFITGDVGYHDALEARERGLCVIDAGHEGTERVVVPVVASHLRETFADLTVTAYEEPEVFEAIAER